MGIVRNLSCKILAGTGPILWTSTRSQGMTWSIGARHTAHSLLVFQTLAYIYGARLAKPRYQVEFKISQLSAFPWLTEN